MLAIPDNLDDRQLAALYRDSSRASVIQVIEHDSTAEWYLIRCAPGRDLSVMRWLSRRRFGVFLPMQGLRRIVPGWLAVFVWDIEAMERRILDCPSVIGILRGYSGRPYPVRPDPIKGDFLAHLRAATWVASAPLPAQQKKPSRRFDKRARRQHIKLKRALKQASGTRALDIRAQISALRQKLPSAPRGAASSVA